MTTTSPISNGKPRNGGRGAARTWPAFVIGVAIGIAALSIGACSVIWPWNTTTETQTSTETDLSALYALEEPDGIPRIRIRIAVSQPDVVIETEGAATVKTRAYGNPTWVQTPAKVRRGASGGWVVRGPSGPATVLTGSGPDSPPLLIAAPEGEMLRIGDRTLVGAAWLHARKDGRSFDVVEHVSIERYLPGVLAKELIAGWKPETFNAQAVAARTYALHERRRHIAMGSYYDVESTTQDQAYEGATSNDRAHAGVRATRGLVLSWKGSLLRAYYSSTTGGRAASARDTWPTSKGFEFNLAAPIQASPRDDADSFSPLYRWTVKRDVESLVRRFRAYGKDHKLSIAKIASLSSIRPIEFNEFGRPTRYAITDTGGTKWALPPEGLRLACNQSTPGLPSITRKLRVNSGDFVVRVTAGTVVFEGRGFGHGVGMSQYGAEGKARAGENFRQILGYYYPGAAIERAY